MKSSGTNTESAYRTMRCIFEMPELQCGDATLAIAFGLVPKVLWKRQGVNGLLRKEEKKKKKAGDFGSHSSA